MRAGVAAWLVDAAAIEAAWAGLLLAESVALGFLWSDQFSGVWELELARRVVVPLACVGLVPAALAVAAVFRTARQARRSPRARIVLACVGAIAFTAVAVGVSQGRHFSRGVVRASFVAALLVSGAWLAARGAPQLARLRRIPSALAFVGLVVAVSAWVGDEYLLPRLYPAFHAALCATTLLGASLVALAARSRRARPGPIAKAGAIAVAAASMAGALSIPVCLRALNRASNLRVALVEHAPLLGRAVALAVRLHAPQAVGNDADVATSGPAAVARSLDWTGRDLLLLTVDALRADHVSAYGYARPSTPNIDALVREGAAFDSAYCATPHTSYSVTSIMTGKYLRPLLALGLGEDSETWAQDLRRYGWRTAAFYPPAVFFIDESRFSAFEAQHLGFEYAKVEFADPELRETQVAAYLDRAPPDRPLFLWVHFFEPHEPYVMHPEHPYSGGPSADIDAYDSEVATADDGIGRILRLVRDRRPGPVVLVTADHGEEFGEHGGRYHGTTVYDEQVRVPLVVVGPGVPARLRVAAVVQTIDLLPTALSALGMPRPARLRGRDLGSLLAGPARTTDGGSAPLPQRAPNQDAGFAFVETDDYSLIASGGDRLVCQRRAAACQLFRPADDPLERRDRGPTDPARMGQLRAALRATERDHGRYESGAGATWPEALLRGLQGDAEAAPDVASLLDDAEVIIRRKAAEVCLDLRAPATAPAVRRALDRDEDDEVRRWSALALARMGEPVPPLVEVLLHDPEPRWRRSAALSLGARGQVRACDELVTWWSEIWPASSGSGPGPDAGRGEGRSADPDGEPARLSIDLAQAQDLLASTVAARCRGAVPALVRALEDVRARPFIVDALGALGDERARTPLLDMIADEPYVTTRPHEARALLALGSHDWISTDPVARVDTILATGAVATRLVTLLSDPEATLTGSADGVPLPPSTGEGDVRILQLPAHSSRRIHVTLNASSGGVTGIWGVGASRSRGVAR